jgi:predicted metal-binding membrane protein
MWTVMMVAMMLPSLVPMLLHYRQAVDTSSGRRLNQLTAAVGVGYFFVWGMLGLLAFPLGTALAAAAMKFPLVSRAVPVATGLTVVIAGVLQFTAWKARHLACCRRSSSRGPILPADLAVALRHGLRLGLHCCHCCAGLTMILLVIGVMDLRAMTVVAAIITFERLAPSAERVARATGAVLMSAGAFMIVTAGL